MKLKAHNILDMHDALISLSDKEMDFDTACSIAKNIQTLSTIKKVIDEKRDKIIRGYAEKDEYGNIVQNDGNVKICDIETFSREVNELLNAETDIDVISISKEKISHIKLAPKELLPILEILIN